MRTTEKFDWMDIGDKIKVGILVKPDSALKLLPWLD